MFINRAISSCPNCATEQEIWYKFGKVEPIDTLQCGCGFVYESSDFITKLLELRSNSTLSTVFLDSPSDL